MANPMFCCRCRNNERREGQRYCRACHAAYFRENRHKWRLSREQQRRASAREMANVYQKRGKLKPRPCEICGDPKVEKHHEDYRKPLEVNWLCKIHHRMVTNGLLCLIRPIEAEVAIYLPALRVNSEIPCHA